MKRIILFTFMFCISIDAQWYLQKNLNKSLSSVYFLNNQVGMIAGDGMFKTTDSGISWSQKSLVSGLSSLQFSEPNVGWAISNGNIVKTTNGGTIWVPKANYVTNEDNQRFTHLYFVDATTGFAIDNGRGIYKSVDGGESWVQIGRTSDLYTANYAVSIHFINPLIGWIGCTKGITLKTTDGGLNWTPVSNLWDAINWSNAISDIKFANEKVGFMIREIGSSSRPRSEIKRSDDGGKTWITVYTSKDFLTLKSLFVLNENIIWAIGPGNGFLIKATDGGGIWTEDIIPNVSEITSIYFTDVKTGWAVCSNGEVMSTIVPSVTLITPNGNENWQVGSQQKIQWSSIGVSNIKIEYTTDNGMNWIGISNSTSASLGVYDWTIPNVPSTLCKVRLTDLTNTNNISLSSNTFIISALPTLSIITPNGGENWLVGSSQNITWKSTNVTNVKIEYTYDNEVNWTTLSNSFPASNSSYSWTVPNTPSSVCKVRISNVTNSSSQLIVKSNTVFLITAPPGISISSPSGGENWQVESPQYIKWSSTGIKNVKIEFSSNNGTNWTTLSGSTPAVDVSYSWIIPNTPSPNCLVRLSDADNPNIFSSSKIFTISAKPSISIISPKGGENWDAGTQQKITWSSNGVDNVKIEYSLDNGTNWITLSNSFPASTASYSWTIPYSASVNCKVRISDLTNVAAPSVSGTTFTIVSKPFISINSPKQGDVWLAGSQLNITWTSGGVTTLKIEFSSDSGTNWTLLSNSTPAGNSSYSWIPPNISSSVCIVRISDAAGSLNSVSGIFRIQRPSDVNIKPISSSTIIPKGTSFWVDVKVGDPTAITDLYGISLRINSSNSNCTYADSAKQGEFLGSSVLFLPQKIDNQTIDLAVSKTTAPGISGSGVVARIKFITLSTITTDQTVIFTLSNLSANNSQGTNIPLTASTLTVTISNGINVWPGDTNTDGIVRAPDVLPIGLYYGQAGPTPNNPGILWQAYPRQPWPADGSTPKRVYADANGDGIINAIDVLTIGLNYDKTNTSAPSKINASTNSGNEIIRKLNLANSSIKLIVPTTVRNKTDFTVKISVGDPVTVTDLYGISFRLKSNSATCKFVNGSAVEGSFLGTSVLKLFQKIDSLTIDAAISKTSSPGVNGSGNIAAFTFNSLHDQTVTFTLTNISANDSKGNSIPLDVIPGTIKVNVQIEEAIPTEYTLSQNYPNPFNPTTKIKFGLPENAQTKLIIYDLLGREVVTLVNGELTAGHHEYEFNAGNLSSGIYFCRISTPKFTSVKKLLLMK